MRKSLHRIGLLLVIAAPVLLAADVVQTDRAQQELSIRPGGLVVIDNVLAQGNIEVIGSDEQKVKIVADRTLRGADVNAINEARQVVHRVLEGHDQMRVIRTAAPAQSPRWNAQVHYTVVIPHNVSVKINSKATGRIRVADVHGDVLVKNVVGPVLIENPRGRVEVETINGNIVLITRQVTANVRLSSVNGSVLVRTAPDAAFTWEAETVMGDAKTAFELHSAPRYLSPTRFRGSINAPGKIAIVTETFGGDVLLMPLGTEDNVAQSVQARYRRRVLPERASGGVGPMLPTKGGDVRLPLVQGFYRYETSIGDVRIDEIRGAARIVTGAGEVTLGTVFGHCDVTSYGGPLTLGEIIGPLTAKTDGGNVSVQRAREGGSISTGGGTIQVHYTGGRTDLSSGGGDIIVRQANGPINAETKSGDITLTLDAALKSGRVTAKTAKGNIALMLPAGFGADIDATVLTSDPTANSIRTDFAGLSLQRDQINGKTRIRATGKINGGGDRLELVATDGGIHITTDATRVSPMVPRQ